MEFHSFDSNAQARLKSYLQGGDTVGSDYSYYAFLLWFDGLEYAESDNGAFFMRADMDGETYYWPPLVKGGLTRLEAVGMLPSDAQFAFATEDFVDETSSFRRAYTHRDWAEYIYLSSDFISMQGKRYHAKRNHITKFSSLYSYQINEISESDVEDVRAFERAWLDAHSFDGELNESAERENEIVREWYRASMRGELVSDILRVDGKVVGVTIGEIMPSGNAVVMYEKADINYEGVYTFLAHAFAERHFGGCKYINRQEDMGLEGLRKSKLSYCPEYLLNKYVLKPFDACETSADELPKSRSAADCSRFEGYGCMRLNGDDYDTLMTFYENGIEKLEDKKFFMNYTPEELKEVLETGYVLGVFYGGELVGACAFDSDKAFGDKLAAICGDTSGKQYYEFSGIMVDGAHRGKGLASCVCSKVITFAKNYYSPCVLCATVQHDNLPSLGNLKKLGFEEKAQAAYKQYDFKYLTLSI